MGLLRPRYARPRNDRVGNGTAGERRVTGHACCLLPHGCCLLLQLIQDAADVEVEAGDFGDCVRKLR